MQDFFGSVRRSLVFRPASEDQENNPPQSPSPFSGAIVEKIGSCIRRSMAFAKPSPPSPPVERAPPIRWRRGELIGCGAFGRVYMGMNLDSGELLAVKQVLIAANCASKEKAQVHMMELEEEVKLLKNLSHPNIVRYLGTVREEESLNILLEFVPGGSISSLLGKFGPFPESVVRKYSKQLLLGLEYLHKHGIMHRDIKGANILVDNKGCIKLADFGASKQVAELATVSGAKSMKGTPYWMAPEVILQTGHSFSADIWSVGCTIIEMVTGKPPWSQQYKEVAALFHIGTTKSHPPIPEHLSAEGRGFLLKCLQQEPNLRPTASELLKHPFVNTEDEDLAPAIRSPVLESHSSPPLQTNLRGTGTFTCNDSDDICNIDTLNCSISNPEKSVASRHVWQNNNDDDDDMCQIDNDDFLNSMAEPTGLKRGNPDVLSLKLDENLEHEQIQEKMNVETEQPSLSEDDDELTESKIRAFLDEKALELKKLQTPLYEEYYNSLTSFSPSFSEGRRDETSPNYLKLPPKSRSPSRGPVGSPSTTASSRSPGSNGRRFSYAGKADQSPQDNASSHNDWRGLLVDGQQESGCQSSAEKERKWKEELDRELERKRREKMRQAGMGTKTSSPKDRGLSRHREKTRFASPSK